jgi:hypothetical protein
MTMDRVEFCSDTKTDAKQIQQEQKSKRNLEIST